MLHVGEGPTTVASVSVHRDAHGCREHFEPSPAHGGHTLTGAEADEGLLPAVEARDPPLIDGAKVLAIDTA